MTRQTAVCGRQGPRCLGRCSRAGPAEYAASFKIVDTPLAEVVVPAALDAIGGRPVAVGSDYPLEKA